MLNEMRLQMESLGAYVADEGRGLRMVQFDVIIQNMHRLVAVTNSQLGEFPIYILSIEAFDTYVLSQCSHLRF